MLAKSGCPVIGQSDVNSGQLNLINNHYQHDDYQKIPKLVESIQKCKVSPYSQGEWDFFISSCCDIFSSFIINLLDHNMVNLHFNILYILLKKQ